MKLKKSIGVLLLLAMFMCVCFAPLSVSAAADFSPQQFLDKQLEAANITGVACVTKNGKVVAESTRGIANTEEGKAVTTDTLFPVASNSKQICATAIFMLKEQGKLTLDDKLSTYFPDYTKGADVTIKHLLTMRSGIRDFQEGAFREFIPDINGTQQENQQMILDWLQTKRVKFKPGGGYDYSNTNYLLLSMIIEQITGDSYENFIKENIFAPLGMTGSGFCEELSTHPDFCEHTYPDVTDLVTSYDPKGCFQGSGDIVSNVKDMDKWLTALREGTLISDESMAEMTAVCSTNVELVHGVGVGYACGLYVFPDGSVCHGGFIDTYVSGTYTHFEDEINVFVVANNVQDVSVDMKTLAHKIATEMKDVKICGDVNGDMGVNIKDATQIQKASAKLLTLTENETLCADVNADSDVNIKDATAIQKYSAMIETDLNIGEFF